MIVGSIPVLALCGLCLYKVVDEAIKRQSAADAREEMQTFLALSRTERRIGVCSAENKWLHGVPRGVPLKLPGYTVFISSPKLHNTDF